MDWLFENPLPELLICGVLAIGFVIATMQKQRGIFLLGTVAFMLLGLGAWLVDRGVQTDREAVVESLFDMIISYQKKDAEGTLKHISPQAVEIRMLVMGSMDFLTVQDDLHITDVSVVFTNENSIAKSHFRVNATVTMEQYGATEQAVSRWEATWQKTGEGWLLTGIDELDPIYGSPTNRFRMALEKI